jgi:hypothetical protein
VFKIVEILSSPTATQELVTLVHPTVKLVFQGTSVSHVPPDLPPLMEDVSHNPTVHPPNSAMMEPV